MHRIITENAPGSKAVQQQIRNGINHDEHDAQKRTREIQSRSRNPHIIPRFVNEIQHQKD